MMSSSEHSTLIIRRRSSRSRTKQWQWHRQLVQVNYYFSSISKQKSVPVQLLLFLVCTSIFLHVCVVVEVNGQLSWTPIYVDTTNQLDLWTIKEHGCSCPVGAAAESSGSRTKNCACCIQPGGCLCTFNHNRCSQCGLEDSCQRFCNITISSWTIEAKSGLQWLQLKSPVLQGPTACWWRLESEPGQRIEIQIHRIINIGSFDNQTQKCTKGYIQFNDGDGDEQDADGESDQSSSTFLSSGNSGSPTSSRIQLCAENSRFSPPIVIFADQSEATLLIRLSTHTTRSQILAYVSFSSINDPIVGNLASGGRRRVQAGASTSTQGGEEETATCDWIYDGCWSPRKCVLTSPGYPGLSPPNQKCRYNLKAGSTTSAMATATKIRIIFHTVNFSKSKQCTSNQITIWKNGTGKGQLGPGPGSQQPFKTICEDLTNKIIDIEKASSATIEYSIGKISPPFIQNGFYATVVFIEQQQTTSIQLQEHASSSSSSGSGSKGVHGPIPAPVPARPAPTIRPMLPIKTITTTTTTTTQPTTTSSTSTSRQRLGFYPITCGHIFSGQEIRDHVFRLVVPKDMSTTNEGASPNNNGFGQFGKYRPFKCQIEFHGRANDVIQFAPFNYQFRGLNCTTTMEIYDMLSASSSSDEQGQSSSASASARASSSTNKTTDRLLGVLCGPSSINKEVQHFISSYNRLVLVILLFPNDLQPQFIGGRVDGGGDGVEFLEGAFHFHDESIDGTVKPISACEYVYYGVTSQPAGLIIGPPTSSLLRLSAPTTSAPPIICGYTFVPTTNQTITLVLKHVGFVSRVTTGSDCYTLCTQSGCVCQNRLDLSKIDHLVLLSGNGVQISCWCGYIQDMLPITFESHSQLTLVYHSSSGSSSSSSSTHNNKPDFNYTIGFQFTNHKILCTNFSVQPPSSSKRWKEILLSPSSSVRGANNNNNNGGSGGGQQQQQLQHQQQQLHFIYFQCVWPISVPSRYKLSFQFISEENEKNCHTWNITIWLGSNLGLEPPPTTTNNDLLFSFCPKEGRKEYQIQNGMSTGFIKLIGVTIRPPQFEIRWKYVDVMLGSGYLTERKLSSSDDTNVVQLDLRLALLLVLHYVI